MHTGHINDAMRSVFSADHNLVLATQMEKDAMIVTIERVAKLFVSIPFSELCKTYLNVPESKGQEVIGELTRCSKVSGHTELSDGVLYVVFDDMPSADVLAFAKENTEIMRAAQLCCAKINKTFAV